MSDITRAEVIEQLEIAIALIKQNGKDWLDERDIPILEMAKASLEVDEAYQLEYERTTGKSAIYKRTENIQKDLDRLNELNHEQHELCEDCISREQALKELKESAEHHANDSREEVLLRGDRDIIRALPPVIPQEPKSEWEYDHEILKAYADGQARVESVLEDIKAEISDMYPNYIDEKGYRMVRKSDVLNIIDKHMESENNK